MATQAEKFQAIAEAIRWKSHRTSTIVADNFAQEIKALPTYDYKISVPLPHLGQSNLDNAYAAAKTAITYWNAKKCGTETFAYSDGSGPLKGDTSATLRNSGGQAVIDCSTFVGLVLRGIDYLSSPYYGTTATTCNPRDIKCKTGTTWAETYLDLQEARYAGPPTFPAYTHLPQTTITGLLPPPISPSITTAWGCSGMQTIPAWPRAWAISAFFTRRAVTGA